MTVQRVKTTGDGKKRRVAALGGVLGVVVFWGTVLLLGTLDPDYSHFEHAMSIVASAQAPFSLVGRAAFVVAGLLIVAFAVGLYGNLRPGLAGTVGAGALVVHGVGRIGEGVFAWNFEVNTLGNTLHTLFGMLALVSMVVAPVVLAWVFRTDDRWGWYYRFTVFAAIAFVLVFVVVGPFSAFVPVPTGLGQRIGFGIWYAWLVGLALGLYRRGSADDSGSLSAT